MENLETVLEKLDGEYEKYCETVNTPAPKTVSDACSAFHNITDEYVAAVTEYSWKNGFQYAVSLMNRESETQDNAKMDFSKLMMSKEELKEIIDEEAERLNFDVVADMVAQICADAEQEKSGSFKNAVPINQITYIAHEMYVKGFAIAMHIMNEALKEYLEKNGGTAI